MLALVGFLIIIVMMLLIFRSKALPAFCFAAVSYTHLTLPTTPYV